MNEKVGYCLKVTPLNSSGSKISVSKVLFPLTSNNSVNYDWLRIQMYYPFDFVSCSFSDFLGFDIVIAYCSSPYGIDDSSYYPCNHPLLASFGVRRIYGPFFIFKRFYVGKKGYLGCFSMTEAKVVKEFCFPEI